MASPSLSQLLHADSALPPPPSQPRHPQRQHTPRPPSAQTAAQSPNTGDVSSTSLSAPGYAYPPPPSSVSPAASGSSNHLATPATSPAATSAAGSTNGSSLPKGHAANTSLYQCADCLRRYSRPEHLQRHIATHTLGKRFVCDICGKAFGRADLLKRHRTNHDDEGNGPKRRRINSSPGAGRVAHACQACAKARVKCEEMKPCTRCRNRNLTCEYASSEAGSAAAMHLLHLSANAHTHRSPTAPVASMGPDLKVEGMPSHTSHPLHMPGVPTPTTAAMTNPAYSQSNRSSPSTFANPPQANHEAAQLPTPETMIDHSQADSYQAHYPQQSNGMADMTPQQFGDFLQNVLYDQQHQQQHQQHQHQHQQQQQQQMDASRMAVAQGLAVLDFCDNANLDMNEMDFGMLDNWNLGNFDGMIATDPNLANYVPNHSDDSADMSSMRQRLVSVWAQSPWRWVPDGSRDNIHVEKSNLPLPDIVSSHLRPDKVVSDKLEPSGRDKILAIVLGVCQNNNMLSRVASSFPSTEVIDSLVHVFLAWHMCQVSEFIHFGSFSMNAQCPEFLAVAAAAGAILTPVKSLRKFGFALQEAVRVTIPNRFEDNNTKIQDASLVQALILGQDIGLWSGNRRRMEIAECHLNIPIAMTRGRGAFQRSAHPLVHVDPADEGSVLEGKWKAWCRTESWKRLIFHMFLRDAQTSMTSMSNMHISYAELTLPLPEHRKLWFAKSAQEWKMHYLELNSSGPPDQPPSLVDVLRDINLLATMNHRLDVQYAAAIVLHAFWSLIREYHQLDTVFRWTTFSSTTGGNANLVLQTRHQELVKTLENFQLNVAQAWPHMLSAQENVVLNLLLMNLHVSLDDLQLFAGKDGEEQARRILPALQRWVRDNASRRAIWHAGQILRWAREFPQGHLKDFYAVAVHHAALALWTWGVITRALRRNGVLPSHNAYNQGETVVYLDMPEAGQSLHQFMGYETGRPAIHGPLRTSRKHQGASGSGSKGAVTESFVEEPRTCMGMIEETLRANFPEGQSAPIVENLCQLINQLGKAAGAVGLG